MLGQLQGSLGTQKKHWGPELQGAGVSPVVCRAVIGARAALYCGCF